MSSKMGIGAQVTSLLVGSLLCAITLGCGQAFEAKSGGFVDSSLSEGLAEAAPGKALYEKNCLICHGSIETSAKLGATAQRISTAIGSVPQMSFLSGRLSASEVQAIAAALNPQAAPVVPGATQKFTCTSDSTRGAAEISNRRLSRNEIMNSLQTIFGASVLDRVPSLSLFPSDVMIYSVSEFGRTHSAEHLQSIYDASVALGKILVADRVLLNSLAPACVGQGLDSGSVNDTCLSQFISSFGERLHRRPLSQQRVGEYLADYKTNDPLTTGFTAKDRFEILVARLVQAPEFLFHSSVTSGQVDPVNKRVRVDAFTVANRLAFQLTEYPPDQILFDAAKSGQLNTLAQSEAQAQRLIETSRGRAKVGALFHHWLKLDKVFAPSPNVLTRLGLSNTGETQLRMRRELVAELKEFVDHVIFEKNGTYHDLLLSDIGVPRSDEMAKILDLAPGTRGPASVPNTRRGLMMRPAILAGTGNDRESPINRGIRLRMRLLCDPVPAPPADADDAAAEALNGLDQLKLSMRQISGHVTGGASCVGCHRSLNSLGYALSSFGPLGEFRQSEKIYNSSNQLVTDLPIDSRVSEGLDIVSSQDSVVDHLDMATLAPRSVKGRACFAQYAFRVSRLRVESPKDSCQLADAEAKLESGRPVKEALMKSVASEDIFWRGVSQ